MKEPKPIDPDKLESWLKTVELPQVITLDSASTITNVPNFFESHCSVLRSDMTNLKIRKLHENRIRIAVRAIMKFNKEV